jgi:hypothetical protein
VAPRETDFYLLIRFYHTSRQKPVFNWSMAKGNISFGLEVAKEEARVRIKPGIEGQYSCMIKLHNDKENKTVFEWMPNQGNVTKSLESLDEYIHVKLGFDFVDQVKSELNVPQHQG